MLPLKRTWRSLIICLAWMGFTAAAHGQSVSGIDQDSSGVVSGVLQGSGGGEPIPYATVSLVNIGRSSFADAEGGFRLSRLAPGSYSLRVRQIGYTPLDTTIAVEAGIETTLSLRLHRVALQLARISVTGRRGKGCVATGVPDSLVNPSLAAIFAQVRENVDR